jgi:hypothetical protein
MKALTPHTITSEGKILFYCKPCRGYREGHEFMPSERKRRMPCRSCSKKKKKKKPPKPRSPVEKILNAIKVKIWSRKDGDLARRWEISDVLAILNRGRSDISGAVAEKMSIVVKDQALPFTPKNSLLVTRFEAMGKRHIRSAC